MATGKMNLTYCHNDATTGKNNGAVPVKCSVAGAKKQKMYKKLNR
jgi:hypothetical protein